MDIASFYFPIALVLLMALLVASTSNSPFRASQFKGQYLVVFLPALFTLLTFLWGTFMAHEDPATLSPPWTLTVVVVLLGLQCVVGIAVVAFMKGFRWFSSFAVLLQIWLGLFATFIAGMSVTGDWV